MKKIILAALFLLALAGCTSMGNINVTRAQFDGATEMRMNPAMVGPRMQLGLFWSSRLPGNELVLTAATSGIKSFAAGESLFFNIDGEKVGLTSIDNTSAIETIPGTAIGPTYIPGYSKSTMRYTVNRDFINKLISAKKVIVRFDLDRDTYIEGDSFSSDMPGQALPAFREFMEKLQNGVQKES